MGYSHSWRFAGNVAPKELKDGNVKFEKAVNLIKAAAAICEYRGIEICGGDGTGKPKFLPDRVVFNGSREKGEDYETFSIYDNDGDFDFCKTGREPYDILACVSLLAFKHYFGDDFSYRSDGVTREDYENRASNEYWKKIGFVPDGPEEEWLAAYELWDKLKAGGLVE